MCEIRARVAPAEAMHRGLIMSLDERQDRWRRLMAQVREHDIVRWRQDFVQALTQPLPDET